MAGERPEEDRLSGTDDRSVTAIVVNYKTRDLTQRCVESLLTHYPAMPLVIIDNGSHDDSTKLVRALESDHPNIRAVLNNRNIYHGPALDQGLRIATTPLVLTLDSDCEVLAPGFVEEMAARFEDPLVYAVGELRYKNRLGFTYAYWYDLHADERGWIPYVHPYAMLVDARKYADLAPFAHHGAPALKNMRSARAAGFRVHHFPVYDFVRHRAGGTSAAHGYDFRSRIRLGTAHYANRLRDRVVGERAYDVRYPTDVDPPPRARR